ncbi:hypothetical protein M885DRAFT_584432 [Pelagophyceae sp. CCMP2097]|nr:hypothetical protein M885DRAFT_584432 [Pelagophyceae sp. CCMP2097]|mmetsp:Transcript_13131/g.46532  ORF Transcript_13131/g.46532 Transcript_13131/m.46532 type:complete len:365 (+) Transcript_13131:32-1126(+)
MGQAQTTLGAEGVLQNERWTLARRPAGAFDPVNDVVKVVETIDTSTLAPGHVVIAMEMLSVDAFIRTMLDADAYHGSVALGATLPAMGYGTVVAAALDAKHHIGTRMLGLLGAQRYAVTSVGMPAGAMAVLSVPGMPLNSCLGLLSLTTGLAAYVGVFSVAKPPKAGEVVVVSAAAGAVGSVAAQLAKSTGARVIGLAGGPTKKAFLLDVLKLDGAIDYKTGDLGEQLDALAPDGVDFFFDNVGGSTLDVVLDRLKLRARVVVCGAASQYSGDLNKGRDAQGRGGGVRGPANYLKLAEKSSTMVGFNVMHHFSSLPGALASLCWMYSRGTVEMHEHVEKGLDAFPLALHKMFNQGHCGKLLVCP